MKCLTRLGPASIMLSLAVIGLCPIAAQADDPFLDYASYPQIIQLGQFTASIGLGTEFERDETYAYIVDKHATATTDSTRLVILNIANPTSPTWVTTGAWDFEPMNAEAVRDIAVEGDYAYVCVLDSVHVIEMSDTRDALSLRRSVGHAVLGSSWQPACLEIRNSYLYVSSGSRLTAYAITASGTLEQYGDMTIISPSGSLIKDMYADGDNSNIYLATAAGQLRIGYLGTPSSPYLLTNQDNIGTYPSLPWRIAIDKTKGFLYTTLYSSVGGGDAYYGFRVHSILNDGEHPVHVGVDESFPSAVATGISLTRDYGCVPYSNNTGRLYDVSMPGDDYLFRTDSLVGAHCIRSTWPHLYTLAGAIGAATFSVSRLQPSERVGAVIGYASSHPQDTATFVDAIYDVQYCYTANHDGGVIVYDVSDPWNPEQVGGVTTPSAETLWIRSDTLFVACGSSGLRAFDIGDDPAEPANITPGSMTSHAAYDIVVYEEKAYIAAGTEGVLVRDLNDTEWDVIGTYNTLGDARGIALRMDASSRTVAYVADGQDGLVLVNAGTPSSMSVLGSFDTGTAKRVVIRDGAAYVADADSGLVIVSVANSTSLSRLSRVAMKNARDVALCGDLAYVADDAFVRVVNCSDTASPARTGVLDCYGPVIGVGGGNYIWAATEDSLMVGLLQAISAPKIITGTCHFHYTIGVDLLADWEFSWRTEEWTDPRLVAVEIIEEGVGSYWLTRDGGAETSVIPVRSGGYLNRLVMRDQVCNGGWEADYVGRSSFQDVDGMRSVTSQSHLKVKLCIAW